MFSLNKALRFLYYCSCTLIKYQKFQSSLSISQHNLFYVYHRTGLYPIPLPSGIGLESCGIIEEVGSDIKFFKIGDRVTHASMPIGAYSEKQIMPEEKLVKVPDGVSDEVASCITLKGITAEYLIHRAYPLKKGDKVLYHAAAGGLGQILCQWANSLGAEVIGTVGSKSKEEIAKRNGCHHVINYSEKDFVSNYVWDKTFDGEKNSLITWEHLLNQSSDWFGNLFGINHWEDRPDTSKSIDEWRSEPQKQPGTHYKYNDVRVNVLAYSLLQVFRESLPKVLKNTIMETDIRLDNKCKLKDLYNMQLPSTTV